MLLLQVYFMNLAGKGLSLENNDKYCLSGYYLLL